MDIKAIKTKPYMDQKTGTSGLRKKVKVYAQENYVENFVQSIFDSLEGFEGKTLILGGDGRYFSDHAIQVIMKMAIANQFGRIVVGQNGILSTPALSHLIVKKGAFGGLALTASHNPGGPDHDFGIKYNIANGAGAPDALTNKIIERTKVIDRYWMVDIPDIDLSRLGEQQIGSMTIEVIDPVDDYLEYMQQIFDFDLLKKLFASDFTFAYDAMNAVTGPYAKRIFEQTLGAKEGSVMNAKPLPDFGGLHPEPNLTYAKHVVDLAYSDKAADFTAASDGDGDRYMILGKSFFLNPSDSLAVMARFLGRIPFYKGKMYGVARTMPTSTATDAVARAENLPLFETPTGFKYFGNLLDAKLISLCGEESFGSGSSHLREKDGLWAILVWLSIVAMTGKSVEQIMREHWEKYGRVYCSTHNYEELEADAANTMLQALNDKLTFLVGGEYAGLKVTKARIFNYEDPVTHEKVENQGYEIHFEGGRRFICRLSGTGSVGATLRVYYSKEITDKKLLDENVQDMLFDVIAASKEILEIKKYVGRDNPSAIT